MDYFFNAEEIFHIAVMIEDNGEKFYNHVSATTTDAKTKDICAKLAGQEHKHRLLFEKLLSDVVNKKGSMYNIADFPQDDLSYLKAVSDSNVFTQALNLKDVSAKIKNTKDAIIIALDFEKDSILFFIQMKKFTRPEWGQAEINKLIEQEQEHIVTLTTLLKEL
ncbi:MAG TPA: ferritin family protein [Planctomycetota bacterium]|nr:ferritin family protein [Planctomycetota bacterium]